MISVFLTDVPHLRAYSAAAAAAQAASQQTTSGWGMQGDAPEGDEKGEDAASGQPGNSREPLGHVQAAACVLRSTLLQHLQSVTAAGQKLLVWDPFCGSGEMILEALGICLGVPPASPAMRFPFAAMPRFDPERYGRFVRDLAIRPRLPVSDLVLVGTSFERHQVDEAHTNLRYFVRTLPRPRYGHASAQDGPLPCTVDFQEMSRRPKLPSALKDYPTLILTNVPYGQRSSRKGTNIEYERFGVALRDRAERGLLLDAYCVSAREDFKRHTGLQWRTELRFENEVSTVDLLRWTGRLASGDDDERPPPPRQQRPRHQNGGGPSD